MIGDFDDALPASERRTWISSTCISRQVLLVSECTSLPRRWVGTATGIGAFFDERVNRYRTCPLSEDKSSTNFALGYPVPIRGLELKTVWLISVDDNHFISIRAGSRSYRVGVGVALVHHSNRR